jgi:hypothetical protein
VLFFAEDDVCLQLGAVSQVRWQGVEGGFGDKGLVVGIEGGVNFCDGSVEDVDFVGVQGYEDVLAEPDALDVFLGDQQSGDLEACAEVGDDVAFTDEVSILFVDVLYAAIGRAGDDKKGVVLLLFAELGASVLGVQVKVGAEVFEIFLEDGQVGGGGFVGQAGVVVVHLCDGVGGQEALIAGVVE